MNKICHLTSVHKPFDVRIHLKECSSLAKDGFDVTFVVPSKTDIEETNGVKFITLPEPAQRRERFLRTDFTVFMTAQRAQCDLVHFHDPELLFAGFLLKMLGKKVVYDVHEDYSASFQSDDRHYIPSGLRKLFPRLIGLMEKISEKVFDGIVAATPSIAAKFCPQKTALVQNFPILDEFQRPGATPYEQRPFDAVYVGGITKYRGIFEMIEAMHLVAQARPSTLQLAGKFISEELFRQVSVTPGWQHVSFKGMLPRDGVAHLYNNARVGLVLFHPEKNHIASQPNKLFEYLSAGLPVIASNFPGWEAFLQENSCGLAVDPLKPEKIAQAILWMFDHPGQAQQMGENGKKAVLEKYNWEVEYRKLAALYKNILK